MFRQSVLAIALLATTGLGAPALAHDDPARSEAAPARSADTPEVKAGSFPLLRHALMGAENLEVIMSRVALPAGKSLPRHTHPGEEFVFMLSGSAILWREGRDNITYRAGDAFKIAPGQVHTAITTDEPMEAVVFRIHVKGEPERTLVE